MPVTLEDMMRELSPDRRAEVEREARGLAADHRRRRNEIGFDAANLRQPPATADEVADRRKRNAEKL